MMSLTRAPLARYVQRACIRASVRKAHNPRHRLAVRGERPLSTLTLNR
ncbi:hypothetical protein K788_0003890 [Paraburkholderia caribensis MBA4]|uniref:Uncharacterized protein n=1 Tax=Paraburkholderia caribensis MBA4 TaxID=1323664 RepID=A0A0P0RAH9_9BURK|nr:hypothetical protein K788_0003890 [Paraburkholderia caribensis MBA4]